MSESVGIRPAVLADYEAIKRIAIPVHVDHARAVPTHFREGGSPLPEDYFHDLIQAPSAEVLVAEHAQEVVGFIILKIHEASAVPALQPRRTVYVSLIAVDASRRGQGIGTTLMQAAIAWGRAHEVDGMELRVSEFNGPAIAFYEHLGMRTETRIMWLPLRQLETGESPESESVLEVDASDAPESSAPESSQDDNRGLQGLRAWLRHLLVG